MDSSMLGGFLGGGLGSLLSFIPGVQPLFNWLNQVNNSFFPTSQFSPQDYFEMWVMQAITDKDYYDNMARLGYGQGAAYHYALSKQQSLDLFTYINLDVSDRFNLPDIQGGLHNPSVLNWIWHTLDIDQDVYNLYKQSRMYMPSVNELNNMYIYNAFDDDIAQRYGLDSLLDENAYANYAKVGVSRYWTKMLWRSTWSYPSFYEAKYMYDYSRAHPDQQPQFTLDDFKYLMQAKNLPPYFQYYYTTILNTPLTISEISRMYADEAIDENDLVKLLKWEGRSDEQIDYLVKWIKIAYAPQSARGVKHYTESMTTDLYMNHIIDKNTFEQYLKDLKYDSESIQVIENYIDLKETLADRSALKADVLEQYKVGAITEEEAMQILQEGGFTQKQAKYIMDKAMLVKVSPHKKLTLSELTKLAQAKLIPLETYKSYLKDIGYSDSDISLLEKLYGFEG